MADQTVRIEKDDVASTAYKMASNLWYEETGKSPKASDATFLQLVLVCTYSLQGRANVDLIGKNIQALFKK